MLTTPFANSATFITQNRKGRLNLLFNHFNSFPCIKYEILYQIFEYFSFTLDIDKNIFT